MAKIDKPSNVNLGANQSWNKQHGYVQTDYKHCDKDALKAAYDAAGRPAFLTWIKDQAGKGVAIPSYPTCVAWMETREGGGVAPKAATTGASKTGLNLEAEFNQAYEQERKTKFLAFLESKRKDLAAQLASVDQEIRNLKTEMGVTDPIVEK